MTDKDDIKDLFQRELGNYEAKVDPGLWQGVQSGISGSASSASTTIGLGAKVVIGIVSVAAITVASMVIYNASKEKVDHVEDAKKEIVSIDRANKETSEFKVEEAPVEIDTVSKRPEVKENIQIEKKEIKTQNNISQNNKVNYSSSNEEESGSTSASEKEVSEQNKSVENTTTSPQTTEKYVEEDYKQKTYSTEPELVLIPSISNQKNQYVKFNLRSEHIEDVLWNFGDGHISTDKEPEHFYDEAGTYQIKVTGTDGDREIVKQIEVNVSIEGEFINLPNAFSPNGDRNHDLLYVKSKGIEEFQITIMNDEQKVIYKSNDVNFKWDGTLTNGVPAPEGSYIYMIVAKDKQGNTINKYQRLQLSR